MAATLAVAVVAGHQHTGTPPAALEELLDDYERLLTAQPSSSDQHPT